MRKTRRNFRTVKRWRTPNKEEDKDVQVLQTEAQTLCLDEKTKDSASPPQPSVAHKEASEERNEDRQR